MGGYMIYLKGLGDRVLKAIRGTTEVKSLEDKKKKNFV